MSASGWRFVTSILIIVVLGNIGLDHVKPIKCDEHNHRYKEGEEVVLWMNTVGPYVNHQETYNYFSLPFCRGPKKDISHYHETIAEAIQGVELEFSGLDMQFKRDIVGNHYCSVHLTPSDTDSFKYAIKNLYSYQMYLDDLPIEGLIGEYKRNEETGRESYYLFTHRDFKIGYNNDRIVDVNVTSSANYFELQPNQQLNFTYTVQWVPSAVEFQDRFDKYLDPAVFKPRIHWFSIFNSFMMVLFLIGLVSMILMRTLRRDSSRDLGDAYGWKQIHTDMFRPLSHSLLSSATASTGYKVAAVLFVILAAIICELLTGRACVLSTGIFACALTSSVHSYFGCGLNSRLRNLISSNKQTLVSQELNLEAAATRATALSRLGRAVQTLGQQPGRNERTICDRHMPWFGIDIGGSLVKVVFFDPKEATSEELTTLRRIRTYLRSSKPYGSTGRRDEHLEMANCLINQRSGSLHFIRFATSEVPEFLAMAKNKRFAATLDRTICATGGGASKFEKEICESLDIRMRKTDELDSIIYGIHYINKYNSQHECYFFKNPLDEEHCEKVLYDFSRPYPYLVVNIGSGVSILAVHSSTSYTRISGSSIGGGTFLGLCSLITQCDTFDEAIKLAKAGSSSKIDKLVKDIYGGDYAKFNLSGDTVASSFGHMNLAEKRKEVSREDLARALLEMVTINIGSIARMCAVNEGIDRVVFIGNFLRVNQLSMRLLSYAVNFWSKGAIKALFLEHEGYFGAVGCFVESTQGCQDC